MIDRYFILPNDAGILQFTSEVLEHIYSYAQINKKDKEAGGQLFSESPHNSLVLISVVTGPYAEDSRSITHFNPCLRHINLDREQLFKNGLHATGLWHTHPESNPNPSNEDRITTLKYLDAFDGEMSGFIQVIMGNTRSSDSLCVWLASTDKRSKWVKLKETYF